MYRWQLPLATCVELEAQSQIQRTTGPPVCEWKLPRDQIRAAAVIYSLRYNLIFRMLLFVTLLLRTLRFDLIGLYTVKLGYNVIKGT
jgi:hypothetical protein